MKTAARTVDFLIVAGARPNFVKVAAIWHAYLKFRKKNPGSPLRMRLVNTGQHYDYRMAHQFFHDLGLPKPWMNLNVGSASHAVQTAKIMVRFERALLKSRPDLVMVVGDVNSTMACAVVAVKMGIPVAHVESGLRSRDRAMPEEINRMITDAISDYLFTTSRDANHNLIQEGVDPGKIFLTGNVMVDTLFSNRKAAARSTILHSLGIRQPYAVLTLHRPSNVDRDQDFMQILTAVGKIQKTLPVIFPVHPRTAKKISQGNLRKITSRMPNLKMVPPVGYLDFIHLLEKARLVLTDSGGIQEETTALGVPCLTLRDNTERPVTVHEGTNFMAGRQSGKIIRLAEKVLRGRRKYRPSKPRYWDGKAAERIFHALRTKFAF